MSTRSKSTALGHAGMNARLRKSAAASGDLFSPAMARLSALSAFPLRRIAGLLPGAGARRDGTTGLPSEMRTVALGEGLLAKARAKDDAFTLAIFDFADLVEARNIYGPEVRDLLLHKIVRELRAVCGRSGIVGRTGKTEFTLIFPGLELDEAHDAIRATLGRPASLEFERDGDEIVLVPDMLVQGASNDAHGHSFARWHARARAALKAQQIYETLRRRRIQLDRERHSRPMPVFFEPCVLRTAPRSALASAGERSLMSS